MSFLSKLEVEYLSGKKWRLTQPLLYASEKLQKTFEVPREFITDFASIPRLLLSFIGRPSGKLAKPSVLHDYLYSKVHSEDTPRAVADALFLEAMEYQGVGWFRRKTAYMGVRIGGWVGFKSG